MNKAPAVFAAGARLPIKPETVKIRKHFQVF